MLDLTGHEGAFVQLKGVPFAIAFSRNASANLCLQLVSGCLQTGQVVTIEWQAAQKRWPLPHPKIGGSLGTLRQTGHSKVLMSSVHFVSYGRGLAFFFWLRRGGIVSALARGDRLMSSR